MNLSIPIFKNQFCKTKFRYLITTCYTFAFIVQHLFAQVSSDYSYTSGMGNPGSVNTQTDGNVNRWLPATIGSLSASTAALPGTNRWSNPIVIPFDFYFYGEKVSACVATLNGLVSFTTSKAGSMAPTGENATLPSTSLPNKTIACFWDYYGGKDAGDWIYIITIGTAPNRQVWIKWHSMRTSFPASANNGYALVLEETTNNIYMVDLYKNSSKAISSTLGMQYDTSHYYNFSSTRQLYAPNTSNADNLYFSFTPSRLSYAGLEFDYADLNASLPLTNYMVVDLEAPCASPNELESAALKVMLDLGDEYQYGSNALSTSVTLNIKGYNTSRNEILSSTGNGLIKQLNISETSPEILYYVDITDFNTSYTYDDLDIISFSIVSDSLSPIISNGLRLRAWIETEYKVGVNNLTSSSSTTNFLQATSTDATTNPVQFNWSSSCDELPYIEFQLLRLYNDDDTYTTGQVHVTELDWDKALAILLDGSTTSLSLNVNEGTGFYAWRVRPIGNYSEGDVANSNNWGEWSNSLADGSSVSYTSTAGLPNYTFYFEQTEAEKNWIYNRAFTEDSRMAENMTYADELLRIRQTQHKMQSDNNALVGQLVYDFTGRGAVKSLASPVSSNSLSYQQGFLQNNGNAYSADDFDGNGNFDSNGNYTDANEVDGGSLTEYYSDSNSDLTIPNAENYPISQTLFDGSGRVREIGMAGETFRIGGGSDDDNDGIVTSRTIKNYYASAVDDELVKIFANEAPDASSVRKIITVDPNKLTTVTYQTVDGKVIATCLSGASGLTEPVEYESTTVSKEITHNSQLDDYTFVKEEVLPPFFETANITVNYSLTPNQIEADCGSFCSTCDYSVEVYVKNADTYTNVWDTSFTYGPESCGTLLAQTMPQKELNGLDAASYVVGRKISMNNINSATGIKYIDEHKNEVDDDMDENIENSYGDLYALLEVGDLDGFYDLLVSDYGVDIADIEDGNSITLNEGCCPVTFTVEKCTLPCDNGTPDFEQLLFDTWGDIYGEHLMSYFFHDFGDYAGENGIPIYPANGTSIAYVDFSDYTGSDAAIDPARIRLSIDYNDDDVYDYLFNAGNSITALGYTQASDIAMAMETQINLFYSNIYASPSDYPYTVWSDGEKLYVEANLDVVARFARTLRLVTHNVDIDHNQAFVESETGNFAFGDGAFNAMINHMINEEINSYSCDSLYAVWRPLVLGYQRMQYEFDENGEVTDTRNDFNLLEAFLSAVGKQYSGVSNMEYGYGDYSSAPSATYMYGYLEYAYKSFYFDTAALTPASLGDYKNCISATDPNDPSYLSVYPSQFNVDGAVDWPADNRYADSEDKTWEQFYNCINGTEGVSSVSSVLDCDNADADCINSIVDNIVDNCESTCDERYDAFIYEARKAYEQAGTTYTDADLDCIASLMVEECKNFCTLTINYNDANNSGTFDNGEEAYSVGTATEQENITKALTAGVDLVVGSSCSADYTSVSSSVEYFSETVAADLNAYLDILIASGATTITHSAIIDKFSELYLIFSGTAFKCNIAIPVATYTIGALSNFEVNTSNELVFNYFSGNRIVYDFECNPSRQCRVCYQWTTVDFSALAQDTLELISCEENGTGNIQASFDEWFSYCKETEQESFEDSFNTNCASAENLKDVLTYSYDIAYHHYTLYYYDRVGNLVKTVPPKGITDNSSFPYSNRNQTTDYAYATTYNYNSLGLLVSKTTPDGGTTNYYYNEIGQLRFSQNAQQLIDGKYSYIKYDALGRSIEAGQAAITVFGELTSKVNESEWPSSGEQRSYTVYSDAHSSAVYDDNNGNTETQQYLLNRISYVYTDDNVYTYYSYDPHGNVSWLIQQIPALGMMKYLKYEYDLISGKVTEVKFNENRVDQFYHRYSYDEDNRLTRSETSRDAYIWDTDATYEYYAHGPLKRTELGEDKVQGLDYVYTLQGWLKAINHPDLSSANDPGQDGSSTSSNSTVAPDAFGMVLNYYDGDFNRTGSALNNTSAALFTGLTSSSGTRKSYYTGIISSIVSNNGYTGSDVNEANHPMANMYLYDDMGRLVQNTVNFFSGGNWIGGTGSTSNYYEFFEYDDNGNISTVIRNGY